MAKLVPFTEARSHLTELLDEVARVHEHLVITRNGKPSAVVMAQEEYDALVETLDILGDPDLMSELGDADRSVAAGKTIPWEEVRRTLGLG